jgi:hypothetical protein
VGYREDSISLRKLVVAKRWFMDSLVRYYVRKGRVDRALWGCMVQVLTVGITVIAVRTGLEYRILRSRGLRSVTPNSDDGTRYGDPCSQRPLTTNRT